MSDQVSILVVDSDTAKLDRTASVLASAGYEVTKASAFHDARKSLDAEARSLLVTGVRLGAYNGLHLILRTRANHPEMPAILMHDVPDPVLEGEAVLNQATFLVTPCSPEVLLNAVAMSLSQHPGTR